MIYQFTPVTSSIVETSCKRFLICLILLLSGITRANAQVAVPGNWDEDIRTLRNTAVAGFDCKIDDWTQYSPAAVMLIAKACGYQGRTGWGQMLVADAFSVAILTGVTRGVKHAVQRPRPDGWPHSFPSGHTGTAFMTATMLHKEYGWRSPWWSIGGYTVAAYTGISRILNNKHWMSDVAAGAAIGIGSVHLGYFLSDLIFKRRYVNQAFEAPEFSYDPSARHYVAETWFSRRFILGGSDGFHYGAKVLRGGSAGLSTDIPIKACTGVTARLSANSLTYASGVTSDMYGATVGGYYNIHFAKRFEFQAKAMAGAAWQRSKVATDLVLDTAFSFMLDDNFKIKVFAEYEGIGASSSTWMHSALVGWGAAWLW